MGNLYPKVLIIILNYKTYQMTIDLVKDIYSKLKYNNFSVLVIDNCSPNESANILESMSKELNYIFIANKNNLGYAAGNNIGIRYGIEHGYEYSWILNNDVFLREENVLCHMIDIAEENKNIGCLGPMIYSANGEICAPYLNRLTFYNMTLGIIREKRIRKKKIYMSGEVYRVYGCCMLLNNNIMNDICFMDERTFLYCEEDILAERMRKKGYKSFYDAEVSVLHKESSTIKTVSKKQKVMQIKENNKSLDIYLKDYRNFPIIGRWICKTVRGIIILLRK